MYAKINSFGLLGMQGYPVDVEVDIANGLPAFDTVGLPDAAVKESKDRVRSAIRNAGLEFPMQRITVNLAPANQRKEGPVYDLPIAAGILMATGQVQSQYLEGAVLIGELSLDGQVRPVLGALPIAIAAHQAGIAQIILPAQNAAEAACIEGLEVIPVADLQQLTRHLQGQERIAPQPPTQWDHAAASAAGQAVDFADIRGQRAAKRAMEIAAAGSHNILMVGPPGSGKTMLARSLPSILPNLTFEEALEVTKIHSIAGTLAGGMINRRPFRAPHHTASAPALTGGGPKAKPGEISLAHYGVLFLDELPEYSRDALEAMRQPMEDGFVTVSRVQAQVTYPAQVMLVASMNPCPCGHFGSRNQPCRCTPVQIQRYLARVSGPLLDRIDLHMEIDAVPYDKLTGAGAEEPSSDIKGRVERARVIQLERYRGQGIFFNSQLDNRGIKKYCHLAPDAQALLKTAFDQLHLSARAHTRIVKVARTIADIEGCAHIEMGHVAEAISYRNMDRKYW